MHATYNNIYHIIFGLTVHPLAYLHFY